MADAVVDDFDGNATCAAERARLGAPLPPPIQVCTVRLSSP